MNIKQSAKLFLGSLLVYVAMASCVASEKAHTHASTSSGVGGTAGASGSGGMGGILDPVPDASAEPTHKSGTRLKMQTRVGDDGSSYSNLTFYDTKFNWDCVPKQAPDGALRCLPYLPNVPSEPWSQYVAFHLVTE